MITDGEFTEEPFSTELMDGKRFWSILSAAPRYFSFMLRHGLNFPELLYPTDNPTARFSSQTGVPGILLTTLPHLTEDHDALFDALAEEVCRSPQMTIGVHYRRLFDRLAEHFGKRQWVERSGALLWVDDLQSLFPDARFVHIVRDGRDVALSMQEHNSYRLGLAWQKIEASLGVHPFCDPDRTHLDRLPTELRPFLPERFDRDAFQAFRMPLAACGAYWGFQLDGGLKHFSALPSDRLLNLRYEDFFTDAKRQLDTLAGFMGDEFIDEDWSAHCAATVRPPRSTWRDLPDEDAQVLTEACRPGFEQLRAAGLVYEI